MIRGTLSGVGGLSGTLSGAGAAPVEQYEGPYEFTPMQSAQTVEIAYKQATEDITINPIPNNYGLITWDGTAITVS